MPYAFSGGLFPPDQKAASHAKPIEKLPPPEYVVLSMRTASGGLCKPCVRAGSYVTVGQKIGEPRDGGAPVHTPVAGRVAAVEPRVHYTGESVLSIVVENDRSNALCPAVRAPKKPESLSADELTALIRDAGVTGMDRDAAPLHLRTGGVHAVIIDACESEPYLTCNYRLLLERPEEILGGARVLARLSSTDRVHIALESRTKDAAALLRQKIRQHKAPAVVDVLYTRYPRSNPKQLCRTITGTPYNACAVVDAAAAAAIYEAVYLGRPVTHRVVTVSGSGVAEPKNLLCPIGTPIRFLLDACGGVDPKTFKILMGGPMTGRAQYDMDAPVEKNTAAVLAFCKDEERTAAHPACIRCGRCAAVCPEKLEPFFLYQYEQAGQLDMLEKMGIARCTECGICSYVCPGRLSLTQSFQTGKQKVCAKKEGSGT